ncbi:MULTISPECIES: hypothetical protein [Pseudomonas syringae group]|uniref:hypothetical protein n=1 Tax=Pseudomonas syringae group TaxID=136849 RepID=UPI0006B8CC49|nr:MULTISPECIES: hypothetical protein [Pseudomonas syringae group]
MSDPAFEKKIAKKASRSGNDDGRKPYPIRHAALQDAGPVPVAVFAKAQRTVMPTWPHNMNEFHAKGTSAPKAFRFVIIALFKASTFSR